MPKEATPDIDIPMAYISVNYDGISPTDAEKLLEQITDKYDLPDKSKTLRCLLDYVEEKESEWDEMFATIRCNRCG